MRAVGLITEYNPFHSGHLHHLRESLRVAQADVSVAVMGGHFLQRGEPALVDKWRRAEMALAAGVDLVVELPLPWACSSAPDFAQGGVRALDALGGIDALCFGSESGCVEPLQACADFLAAEEVAVRETTAKLLRRGMTYPQARAKILAEQLAQALDPAELAAPNNILGIEYLKALRRTGSPIQPFAIQRIGAGYHDTGVEAGGIASATGIRQSLKEGRAVDGLLPSAVLALLQQTLSAGYFFADDRYFPLLLAQIFRHPARLELCWLVENGIENRLLTVADQVSDLQEMIDGIKSRQFTRTRIQRMLVAILLGMEKIAVTGLLTAGPLYLHLLGASEKGQAFLARRRQRKELPLIQNFSRIYAILKRYYGADSLEYQLAMRQLDLELRATKIYSLLLRQAPPGKRNRDFYENLRTAVPK